MATFLVGSWNGKTVNRLCEMKNYVPEYSARYNERHLEVLDNEWLFAHTVEVGRGDGTGCWVWTGNVSEKGTPNHGYRSVYRIVAKMYGLKWEVGKVHPCPKHGQCVNPDHFSIGGTNGKH